MQVSLRVLDTVENVVQNCEVVEHFFCDLCHHVAVIKGQVSGYEGENRGGAAFGSR
jgi:hypothetical protein